MALSSDIRWRIVWLLQYKGFSLQQIADLLYIHVSTARRILFKFHQTGTVSPKNGRRGPQKILKKREESRIITILLDNPGIYLKELQQELFRNTGTLASTSMIFRTICRLGFTRKRIRYVIMQQDATRREEFMEEMNYINASMIVWLDETGSDRRMASYHLRGGLQNHYSRSAFLFHCYNVSKRY